MSQLEDLDKLMELAGEPELPQQTRAPPRSPIRAPLPSPQKKGGNERERRDRTLI